MGPWPSATPQATTSSATPSIVFKYISWILEMYFADFFSQFFIVNWIGFSNISLGRGGEVYQGPRIRQRSKFRRKKNVAFIIGYPWKPQ